MSGEWTNSYEAYFSDYQNVANDATNPRILYIDLGKLTAFDRYVIRHDGGRSGGSANNNTSDFRIEISEDANGTTGNTAAQWASGTWTAVDSVVGNKANVTDVILNAPVTARRVRLYITKSIQGNTTDTTQYARAHYPV